MKTDTLLFGIQKVDDVDGTWLCAIHPNKDGVIPLAMFIDDDKRILFSKILNNGLIQAEAKGQLGI